MNKQPHLCVSSEQVPERAIVCGDPARVDRLAALLDNTAYLAENREFRLLTGFFSGKPVIICSTGIGAPSAIIALEELVKCGVTSLIRVGSSGALQPYIRLGELVIADAAVRNEGASNAYIESRYPASADASLSCKMEQYVLRKSAVVYRGVVRSHDSFYTDSEDKICDYWSQKGVLAADMETSALLVVGRLRGIRVASVLNTVVTYQQNVQEGISEYVSAEAVTMAGEKRAAQAALHALTC
ncbi:Uridine phosphorylase [invertebrate metagenome]|uniref:Uridine phosphorylase n=1 Tax=invertebrate metagenome TaxID=1711999 RepID=A0A2H9T5D7_9ZZZZ